MTKLFVSVKIIYKINVGEIHDISQSALLQNIDITNPLDISFKGNHCEARGNYFVSDFVVAFFKAVEGIIAGDNLVKISQSLSPELNHIEHIGDQYVFHLWDIVDREYKDIYSSYEEFIRMTYMMKIEYEKYIKNMYRIENVLEFQLFHVGAYSKLI